ncbi:hypothetical protein C0Q70_08062 [Pomacea canaliculata]|uniref:Uncharacterized protein n=1 Tax=Pomacea canaliculata TaxID=400727 RepID=A0A2T7PGV3_POMCA|nr:hypothetical protein C0Q70_08062 [Pomacea canaliculata]
MRNAPKVTKNRQRYPAIMIKHPDCSPGTYIIRHCACARDSLRRKASDEGLGAKRLTLYS